jgi:hypothetical protein
MPPTVKTIKAVDFANFQYGDWLRLTNGKYKRDEPGNFEDARLMQTWFFASQGSQPDRALVYLDDVFGGGSSSDVDTLMVFAVREGHPVVVQKLTFDSQASGTGVKFDPATRKLVVTARSNDDSPHCCPASVDVVALAWTPKGFVQTGRRVVAIAKR